MWVNIQFIEDKDALCLIKDVFIYSFKQHNYLDGAGEARICESTVLVGFDRRVRLSEAFVFLFPSIHDKKPKALKN